MVQRKIVFDMTAAPMLSCAWLELLPEDLKMLGLPHPLPTPGDAAVLFEKLERGVGALAGLDQMDKLGFWHPTDAHCALVVRSQTPYSDNLRSSGPAWSGDFYPDFRLRRVDQHLISDWYPGKPTWRPQYPIPHVRLLQSEYEQVVRNMVSNTVNLIIADVPNTKEDLIARQLSKKLPDADTWIAILYNLAGGRSYLTSDEMLFGGLHLMTKKNAETTLGVLGL